MTLLAAALGAMCDAACAVGSGGACQGGPPPNTGHRQPAYTTLPHIQEEKFGEKRQGRNYPSSSGW